MDRRQEFSAREMHEGLLAIEFLAKCAEVSSGAGAIGSVALSSLGVWREEFAVLGVIAGVCGMGVSHKLSQWAHKGAEQHLAQVPPNPGLDRA